MALVVADRVQESSTTTGTGTYDLAGAVSGFQGFVAGIGNGNTCYYCATMGSDWEVGIGTVTDAATDTLARTSILASSNSNNAVNWGAGTKFIFVTIPAGAVYVGPASAVTDGHIPLFDGTSGRILKTSGVGTASFAAASHTHAVADLSDATANGRSLISAANYAAMRALLDLEAGTDFLALASAAPLASPAFTGTPTVPTAALNTDTTQAASTAFVKAEIENIERNTQTGTTYTLVIGDAGKMVTLNNASAITLTIPANASVAFPVGTRIDFAQLGAGQVTFAITSDTLRSSGSKLKLTGQYSGATIYKLASTEWILIGDIAS